MGMYKYSTLFLTLFCCPLFRASNSPPLFPRSSGSYKTRFYNPIPQNLLVIRPQLLTAAAKKPRPRAFLLARHFSLHVFFPLPAGVLTAFGGSLRMWLVAGEYVLFGSQTLGALVRVGRGSSFRPGKGQPHYDPVKTQKLYKLIKLSFVAKACWLTLKNGFLRAGLDRLCKVVLFVLINFLTATGMQGGISLLGIAGFVAASEY